MLIKLIRWIISIGVAIILVAALLPWGIYLTALANIVDRPALPEVTALSEQEEEAIWFGSGEKGPMEIEVLSPWYYVLKLSRGGVVEPAPGERIASFIARDHNSRNLKDKRMLYWHVSGAALTVWLTRNWTSEQILAKAYELHGAEQSTPKPVPQLTQEPRN